jgi:hypothetical protein
MKALLLALSLVPPLAFADAFNAQKPVICDDVNTTMITFENKYGEKPTLVFKGKETLLIITMNAKTGSWTALETQNDGIVCLLAAGEGFSTLKGKE